MTEITEAGYQTLRDFIQNNWSYVELRNESGTAVIRIPTSDPRCTWVHAAGDRTLRLQIMLSGTDVDITLPVTVAGVAFYAVATGGSALAEGTFTAATLTAAEDQVKVEVGIQVPIV